MNANIPQDRTVIFFRNQSDFCLSVSKEMKKKKIDFLEIITDANNYHEMPCIISPDYASAFRGESWVLKFLFLISKETAR